MNELQLRAYAAISGAAQEMAMFYSQKDPALAQAIENAVMTLDWAASDVA